MTIDAAEPSASPSNNPTGNDGSVKKATPAASSMAAVAVRSDFVLISELPNAAAATSPSATSEREKGRDSYQNRHFTVAEINRGIEYCPGVNSLSCAIRYTLSAIFSISS
jgi:hypothetical protein